MVSNSHQFKDVLAGIFKKYDISCCIFVTLIEVNSFWLLTKALEIIQPKSMTFTAIRAYVISGENCVSCVVQLVKAANIVQAANTIFYDARNDLYNI